MGNLAEAIQSVRLETIDLLHDAEALWQCSDLSQTPLGLGAYRKKLTENVYKVLVVGEAKRGKSTFVNAVIGSDILPTDVDIATCQVFRVLRAEQEAYRVRYEDGSAQRIERADLPKYGSQVYADSGKAPSLDEVVRWIEVDVPVRFLPGEIELLDTPGLGSLYAGHAVITQRFVPNADGVIFVLGSNHPISDVESHSVEQLSEVTGHIFFIQTMIDQHRREHWQSIQERNESILREKFGNRLGLIEVWPISSTNLRKAAATGDEDYLKVSRFPELARALRVFLFRTSGWAVLAEAVTVAQRALAEATGTLAGRHQAVLEQSDIKRRQYRDQVAAARRTFDEQWGARGEKRRGLLESVHKHANLARQSFQQTLHPAAGAIAQSFHERIDSLKSLDEARAFAAKVNEEIISASLSRWRSTCDTAMAKAREDLLPFLKQARPVDVTSALLDSSGLAQLPAVSQIESRYFARIKAGFFDARTTGTMVGTVGVLAVLVVPTLVPLAIGAAAVAFVAGAIQGTTHAMAQELLQVKQQLKAHIVQVLQNVQQRFFGVDQAAGRYSVVEEFCRSYEEGIGKSVDEIAAGRQEELRVELARLDEQMKMTEQQRIEQGDRLARLLQDWKLWAGRLEAVSVRLGDIDEWLCHTKAAEGPSKGSLT